MQNKRLKKYTPEQLARFWPPPFESFAVGTLRGLQVTCLLNAYVALINFYFNLSLAALVGLPVLTLIFYLVSFYRGLWLSQNFRPNHLLVVMAEIVGIVVVLVVTALIIGQKE